MKRVAPSDVSVRTRVLSHANAGWCALVFAFAVSFVAPNGSAATLSNQDPAPTPTPAVEPAVKPVDTPPPPSTDKPAVKPDVKPDVKPNATSPIEAAPQSEAPSAKPQALPVTPATKLPEHNVEKQAEKHSEKPEGNLPAHTPAENPAVRPTEDPAVRPTEDPAVRPTEDPAVRPTEDSAAKSATTDETALPNAAPNQVPSTSTDSKGTDGEAKHLDGANEHSDNATPTRPVFDYSEHATQATFEAEVRRLVTMHANRLRVTSLGKSRNGRDLWLLTISDLVTGDPDKKPALFVATGLDPSFEGRPAGPEAALFALRSLLESADRDPTVAAWLAHTTVYVVPAPDPDQVFAPETVGARACRLDRNFPSDWKPWSSESCAQGPYPLSEPETQNLARFLAARANIGAALLFARGLQLVTDTTLDSTDELERILCGRIVAREAAVKTERSARVDDSAKPANTSKLANTAKLDDAAKPDGGASPDHAASDTSKPTSEKSAGDTLARRSEAFARESGSLAAFCRARLSAFVVALDPNVGPIVDAPRSGVSTIAARAPAGFGVAAAAIERLARELPRLECTIVKSERLRERLWMVDIDIENQGLLPTLGENERASCPGSVWFEATGGRVAQVGIARTGTVETNAAPKQPGVWLVGHLDGREKARLHVVVEAAEATTLDLVFRTLRDGETKCVVTLH